MLQVCGISAPDVTLVLQREEPPLIDIRWFHRVSGRTGPSLVSSAELG